MIGDSITLSLLLICMSSLPFLGEGSPASVAECSPSLTSDCSLQSLNISFPFTRPDQAPDCGLPEYHLSCFGEEATIRFGARRYHVKAIDYARRRISVAETGYALRGGCTWSLGNTTLDRDQFDLADGNENLVLFGCAAPLSASSLGSMRRLDCASDSDGRGVFWYYCKEGEMDQVDYNLLESCDAPVVVPLRSEALAQLKKAPPTVEKLRAALSQGFDVLWKVQYEWCTGCFQPSETCDHSLVSCYCSNNTHLWWSCTSSKSGVSGDRGGFKKKLLLACCALLACLLLCTIIALLYIRRNRCGFSQNKQKSSQASVEDFLVAQGPLPLTRFSYKQVKQMTNSFHTKLGHGGHGSVFRGNLTKSNALVAVAVKLMGDSKGSGEDFINEVASIGRTNHINIVSLLGFCSDGSKRALIYEFMPNGSLEKYLFSSNQNAATPLGWDQLYNIALGIAKGLEYLHKGCRTRIVHFDIKPHNILLDKDLCPKISDFGMAKLCRANESILSMDILRGTVGYIAPEVFSKNFGVVSSKSDVYSYGMMVLEMVGGRRNFDGEVEKSSEMYFPHWIYEHLDQNTDLAGDGVPPESADVVRKMAMVGLWCIQTNPSSRPSISRAVEMLEGSVEDLEMPPKPYICSPKRSIPDICSSYSSSWSADLI